MIENKKEIPIENIKKVFWEDLKVRILFKDGTTLISNAEDIILIAGYKNTNDIPLNDSCL
jgi:hypothetical protein